MQAAYDHAMAIISSASLSFLLMSAVAVRFFRSLEDTTAMWPASWRRSPGYWRRVVSMTILPFSICRPGRKLESSRFLKDVLMPMWLRKVIHFSKLFDVFSFIFDLSYEYVGRMGDLIQRRDEKYKLVGILSLLCNTINQQKNYDKDISDIERCIGKYIDQMSGEELGESLDKK